MPAQSNVVNQFKDADKTIRVLIDLLIAAYVKSKEISKEAAKQLLIQDLIRLLRKKRPVEATGGTGGCVLPDGTVVLPEECAMIPCSSSE